MSIEFIVEICFNHRLRSFNNAIHSLRLTCLSIFNNKYANCTLCSTIASSAIDKQKLSLKKKNWKNTYIFHEVKQPHYIWFTARKVVAYCTLCWIVYALKIWSFFFLLWLRLAHRFLCYNAITKFFLYSWACLMKVSTLA